MPAIKVATFEDIVNFYGQAQQQIAGVASYYWSVVTEIVDLTDVDVELECLSPVYSAYLASNTIFTAPPQAAVQAVKALTDHILNHARTSSGTRFSDINDWLDAHGDNGVGVNVGRQNDTGVSIHVNSEYATLSGLAGYSIEDGNIQ